MQNIIISTGSDGTGTKITIYSAKISESVSKNSIYYDRPRTKPNWPIGRLLNVIDLLRIKRQFTITGFIKPETNAESCNTARKRLFDMFVAGGTDYMFYPVYNAVSSDFPAVAPTLIEISYDNLQFEEAMGEDYQSTDINTQLDGALNSTATTITVLSTTAFAGYGVLHIDNEAVLYTSKTGTTFTGCTRGYLNTVASSHNTGVDATLKKSIFETTGNDTAMYAVTLTVTEATHR